MNFFKGIILPVLAAGSINATTMTDGIKANDTVKNCKEFFAQEFLHVKGEKNFNTIYTICSKNNAYRVAILKEKCKELDGKISSGKMSDGIEEKQYCTTKFGNLTKDMLTIGF